MKLLRVICFLCLLLASGSTEGSGSLELDVVCATMTQIVMQWENAPLNTVSFELQRATDPSFTQDLKTYSLDKHTLVFSDTDRPTVSNSRFMGHLNEPVLDKDTIYYYRVKALLDAGGSDFSNTVQAQVSGPVRGLEGDLWADVVLGKPDFAQNVVGKPYRNATSMPGGVLLDKTVRPNRMYIADCNNNRILGFEYLGVKMLGIEDGENIAEARPYVKSDDPAPTYGDAGGSEFTDGILSSTYANSFGYTIPVGGTKTVDIDVDLDLAQECNLVIYSTGGGQVNYRAASLVVLVSDNGSDWTEVGSQDNPDREAEMKVYFETTQARYIRFRGTSQPHVQGAVDWFFIGEGKVIRIPQEALDEVGEPCSTDSDCFPGNYCMLTPDRGADIVLGQPDFGSSAGNGDSTAQTYPYRSPASATRLCLTHPTQISMAETIVAVNFALDSEGNLYVPDIFNNRILKYDDPFGTDTVADEVWGQADFTGNEPNRGQDNPAENRLRYFDSHCAGIAFDADGNMWNADTGNHRVLRFPKDPETGTISKSADIVLGQQSFTTRIAGGYGRTLAEMWYPRDVEFDSAGRLYVCDGITNLYDGRIIVFDPPFTSGMSATKEIQIPMDLELNPWYAEHTIVNGFAKDVDPNKLWVQKNSFTTELFDLEYGESVTSVMYPQSTAADVDCDGNLFVVSKWYGTYRYPSWTWYTPWSERQNYVELAFPTGNAITDDSTGSILGITTFGEQLLISERSRILIWNNYDIDELVSGQAADDLYGEEDFNSITWAGYHNSLQVDGSNRLWTSRRISGSHHILEAFQYPLTHDSVPVKQIVLRDGDSDVLAVRGGGGTRVAGSDAIDFAPVSSGDKIWLADRNNSRALRLNNVDGLEDPLSDPWVDIVLGQDNITDGERNQGGSIGPQTLAVPYNVGISRDGDLLITDNGGEVGSNLRIIQYDANRFPDNPPSVLFNSDIGDPDTVIGTEDSFYIEGLYSSDPMCCPFELGLHTNGAIVAAMNGYSGQRFPLVYLDFVSTTMPQFALGDFTSYPGVSYVDAEGNVYVGDYDWFRVLIYKKPLKSLNDYFTMLDIRPVGSTENVAINWRSRPARVYKVFWTEDEAGPSTMWHEATGPEAVQSGTGDALDFTDDGDTTFGDSSHAPLGINVGKRYYRIEESRD